MVEEFVTIKNGCTAEIVEKKSKFIANLFYIENSLEAEEKIKQMKKKYYDARHNCIAYRVIEEGNIIEKSSDDGEPSGTAGAPMLSVLQKNNLCNVIVIVTRYFGGILLGTGGLVRAYQGATLSVIENAEKIEKCKGIEAEIEIGYTDFENFKYYAKKNQIAIVEVSYSNSIICKIELKDSQFDILKERIMEKTVNAINLHILSKKYIEKIL